MKKNYLAVTMVLAVLVGGCQGSVEQSEKPCPVKVKLMTVEAGEYMNIGNYSGTVEEENGTALSFSVSGTVKTLQMNVGQHVAGGQLLATLDPASLQSSYKAAKASLAQAEDAYRRMKELHDKGSLPEIQWVEVQSKLEQARSLEEIAGKNLEDSKLYAPYSGVISQKNVEIGQNVMPGMTVAKLVTASLLKVKIAVPETEIALVSVGEKAEIAVPALGDRMFTGTVIEKGIVANPLSRSYDVKIRVEGSVQNLMPGMVAEVDIVSEKSETVAPVIPASVVQLDEDNNYFVWLEESGKAVKRIVRCGQFTADGIVILSGLREGERIIVEGRQKVCEGTPLMF